MNTISAIQNEIDFLIHINKIRLLLPHFRLRLMASFMLKDLYEEKGLDPDEVKLAESATLVPNLPEDDMINECWECFINGDIAGALKAAHEAVHHFPDSAEAWFALGMAKHEIRDFTEAEGDYKKAIRLNPSESVYYFELGALFESQNDYANALSYYERAESLSPETVVYKFCIGGALHHLGQMDSALKYFERSMEIYSDLELVNTTAAIFYNEYAMKDWIKTENGYFCVSEKSADHAVQYIDKALSFKHVQNDIVDMLHQNRRIAVWAKGKHWGLSIWGTVKGLFGLVIFTCIVAGIAEATAGMVWFTVSLIAIPFLWVIGNLKTGWKINNDGLMKQRS